MTATSAGSSSCLPAKGLDISLAALQRQDPYINNIVDVASQVALYTYNRTNEWEKTDVEGTLFIYTRLASPRHGFTIMNRLSMENLTEPITKDLDFQLQDPFLLYRNARQSITDYIHVTLKDNIGMAGNMGSGILTQQEQVLAQSQGGWLSPGGGGGGGRGGGGGGGGGGGKSVDIIQMLTKAHTEYDKKSTSEPKEIGGSSVLYGNPNLIKPIPVKPNTQDGEVAESKPLSLATLFGSQHHHSSKPEPVSPLATSGMGSSTGKVARPPVARTLTYDATLGSGQSVASGCSDGGTDAHQNQQHCPAIQKLIQGQRGVGGVGGVLQTVSESPENRLCDNGVPLEHHHHHHHLYHHQQHRHHQQQQIQPDPIKRLFQIPPPPPTSFPDAPPCHSIPSPLQQNPLLSTQPIMVDSVPCSHPQAQQSQQLFFSLPKPQLAQHNNQSATTAQGTVPGLLPSQVSNDQVLQLTQGLSSQMQGVVSPHELLQKLQLVQQEQSLASHDPPRLCPMLAPRFLAPTQSQSAGSTLAPVSNQTTAGQKTALQLQVISPQRIPATVTPTMLLSPSVFIHSKSSSMLSVVAQDSCSAPSTLSRPPLQEEIKVLSKSQLQATLLHLIQADSSFLDTIYEAYISRFANDSSSKY
ncbi:hypothetical protein PAMP_015040 [Pampus punctatissimus]